METTFKNLKELINEFQDEGKCRAYLEHLRWNDKPKCPVCGNEDNIYRLKDGKTLKCGNNKCYKRFTVTMGTYMESSKIKLSSWFMAFYICGAHKKGVSSVQLAKDIGVTQKTAWFMLHRIREGWKEKDPKLFTGTVESDETFIGGKNKNRHSNKKIQNAQGRSFKDKVAVMGLIERESKTVRTFIITNTRAEAMEPILLNNIAPESTLMTDEWWGYRNCELYFLNHKIVRHDLKQYVNEDCYTNTLEGFWSLLKKSITGIYHNVSKKHLQKYCDEMSYRYNTRGMKDAERFTLSLKKLNGRLTYNQLIKKHEKENSQEEAVN